MRVALVAASTAVPCRGNFTTIERWIHHRYEDAELVRVPPDPEVVLDPAPDLVHGYHALHGGIAAAGIARRYGCPMMIALGGTDLWRLMERRERHDEIEEVLRRADGVTAAFESFGRIADDLLGGGLRFFAVPRAIAVADTPAPRPVDGLVRALLPCGLRDVKDPMHGVELVQALARRGVPIRLTVMGPVIDEEYARGLEERAAGLEFVRFEVRQPDAVAGAYREADVVWNTSIHEGGANALLEGLSYGCAVYARDVLGNRDFFVEPDAPATLFEPGDVEGAERFHRALLEETPDARAARAERGRAWLRDRHSPALEAHALEGAWREVLASS